LSRSGHAVATASNGRLAPAMLAERTFKLILCDLLMPELEGLPLISVHPLLARCSRELRSNLRRKALHGLEQAVNRETGKIAAKILYP
jgi:DNA-binding NarL/FixJ family response regulator